MIVIHHFNKTNLYFYFDKRKLKLTAISFRKLKKNDSGKHSRNGQ